MHLRSGPFVALSYDVYSLLWDVFWDTFREPHDKIRDKESKT